MSRSFAATAVVPLPEEGSGTSLPAPARNIERTSKNSNCRPAASRPSLHGREKPLAPHTARRRTSEADEPGDAMVVNRQTRSLRFPDRLDRRSSTAPDRVSLRLATKVLLLQADRRRSTTLPGSSLSGRAFGRKLPSGAPASVSVNSRKMRFPVRSGRYAARARAAGRRRWCRDLGGRHRTRPGRPGGIRCRQRKRPVEPIER
jgi:hypothetical protein